MWRTAGELRCVEAHCMYESIVLDLVHLAHACDRLADNAAFRVQSLW